MTETPIKQSVGGAPLVADDIEPSAPAETSSVPTSVIPSTITTDIAAPEILGSQDVTMSDAAPTTHTATPATSGPVASVGPGPATPSRTTSALPADQQGTTMPAEVQPHGAPTRQYLNSKITIHLLEGMKIIAKDRPADPLRVLGEFLLQKSREIES